MSTLGEWNVFHPNGGAVPAGSSYSIGRIGKKLAEVLLMAGAAWAIAGCGAGPVAPHAGGPGGALALADSISGMQFSLSVVDGSPTLTEIGHSGTPATEPLLIDSATGEHFSLAVTSGALTLVPNAGGATPAAQIALVDTVTAKTYELAVVSGGLTLIAN
jgi:hypothetical protein